MSTLGSTLSPGLVAPHARQGGGWWGILAVAVLCLLFGLPILAGGIYLAFRLGGSLYYAPAGLGLVLTGILLLRLSVNAFWIYLLTYLGTLAWAFWEVGFDWWAQVPRLVAPTVLLVLLLLVLPSLLNRDPRYD